MRITYLIFLFVVIISLQLFASKEKGKVFIQNYSQKTYKGHAQNWSVIQANNGIMYFGNGDGILEYDGVNWRIIQLPRKTTLRAMEMDDSGRIYVGSVTDLGYLEADSSGAMTFSSLLHLIPEEDQVFQDIWSLFLVNDTVYFRAANRLFKYFDNQIKVFRPETRFSECFVYQNELYVRQTRIGLFNIINDSLVMVPRGEEFSNKSYIFCHYINEDSLLMSNFRDGMFYFHPKNLYNNKPIFSPFSQDFSDKYRETFYYSIEEDKNNNLAIATLSGGTFIIDQNRNLKLTINRESGLINESVHDLIYDQNNDLWIVTNNGISLAEVSSPITFWDENSGLSDAVEAITRYKGEVYIATHDGIAVIEGDKTIFLEGSDNQCWSFLKYNIPNTKDTILLYGESDGVFQIKGRKLIKLLDDFTAFELLVSKKDPSLIYYGENAGLGAIKYENGKFKDLGLINNFFLNIRSIAEMDDGTIWLGSFRSGAVRVTPSNDFNNPKEIKIYKQEDGFGSLKNILIYPFQDDYLFGSDYGLYKYNKEQDKFETFDLFGEKYTNGSHDVFSFVEMGNGDVWISGLTNRRSPVALYKKKQNGYDIYDLPFKRIPHMLILGFYAESDGTTWIGGTEGLYNYDPKMDTISYQSPPTLIREIRINRDSVIYRGKPNTSENGKTHTSFYENTFPEIEYKYNSIIFSFSIPSYSNSEENKYKYFLEGYDDDWTNWENITLKEYTNLPEGEYIFHVKGKNIYGIESKEASYEFEILPPFYRTIVAYIIYIILLVFTFVLALRLYSKRLKAQNLKLEKIISERTAEVVQQKEELQSQAEQLKKLSIVASETNNAVIIMDKGGDFEWVNEGFTRMYGYNLTELIDMRGKNIFQASTHPKIRELLENWKGSGNSISYETLNFTKENQFIWAQTTITPVIGDDDKIEKLIAIDSDITDLKEAEEQIKQKNNDITDSIAYAKRIQEAILPNKKEIQDYINELLIFYMPKDIVSGDFYWFTQFENKTVIAAADCTGHGVPGAFMSLIGISFLNKIVNEKGITDSDEILNRLRKNVTNSLHQTGKYGESMDGMDISLIVYDKNEMTIEFSGAMNSIYIFRNGELNEYAADKMPIGIYEFIDKPFSKQVIEVKEDDVIYMFSDGYSDQFGEKNNQKLKYSNFKKILHNIHQLSIEEQYKMLNDELENWKGKLEQVDDILILGLKI